MFKEQENALKKATSDFDQTKGEQLQREDELIKRKTQLFSNEQPLQRKKTMKQIYN